jgi:RimJ/RimL family protein N-acetyltransferase
LLGLADPQNGSSIHALEKLGMKYLHDASEPGRPNRSVFCLEVGEWRQRVREQRAQL